MKKEEFVDNYIKKYKKEIWREFLKKKSKEIAITLFIIVGIMFIPYYTGLLFFECKVGLLLDDTIIPCHIQYWYKGIIMDGVVFIIILGVVSWLKSNWKNIKEDYKYKAEDEWRINKRRK